MPLPEPPIASIGNRHPFLFAFRSARFRFRLCTVSHVELPAEKGSTFHGALGHLSQRQAPLSYRFLYEPTSTETAPASHRSETYRAPSRSCHRSRPPRNSPRARRSAWSGRSRYGYSPLLGGTDMKKPAITRAYERRLGVLGSSYGSPGRTRTADPVINSHLLYQLSYRGIGLWY